MPRESPALCVPLGFIQGGDSKDVTQQQGSQEHSGILVIIVYLCLFSFNWGKLTFTNGLCKRALNGPVMESLT